MFSASIISWHFLAPRSHSSCSASFSVKVLDICVDSLWFLFHIMQSSSIYMVQSLICLLPSVAFPCSQNNGFPSSHVGMWELDHKEGWVPKNWCFWTVVLKKTLEGPLFLLYNCKEIKQVNPKGNQLWILIGRTDAKAEAPILWPPDTKIQFIGKDRDAGKDWRQEEKETTEDKMVGWHHRLKEHESELALGDGEGQGSLASMRSQRVVQDWATE